SKIDLRPLRPVPLAVAFEGVELVVEYLLRFVEKPSDQRRLAVVDASAGDEAQKLLRLLLRKPRPHVVADQLLVGLKRAGHLPSFSREGEGGGSRIKRLDAASGASSRSLSPFGSTPPMSKIEPS